MRISAAIVAVLVSLGARPAAAFESPLAAATYAEGLGFSNGGGGAHRLRGVGIDWISYEDDVWILVGATAFAPAAESDHADMTAGLLRIGFVGAETPDEDSHGIDPLMGFLETTFNILHTSLANETRNGLGLGLRLGVYGLLPPKGVLYYRVAAGATGGHLVSTDDAFAMFDAEISIGLLLAP